LFAAVYYHYKKLK